MAIEMNKRRILLMVALAAGGTEGNGAGHPGDDRRSTRFGGQGTRPVLSACVICGRA
jgi:hypothetical protein